MTTEEAIRILEGQFDKSCRTYRYQNAQKLDFEDALWMAISALREQEERRWIPVTERLPGNDDFVLVIVFGKAGCITLENATELAQFSMDEGWILEMWPEWEDPKVTYWTPLPEPPGAEAALEVQKGGD